MSVLSPKGLSLMPPRTIAVPGSLRALFIFILALSSHPHLQISHSANFNAEVFPIYQMLAVEALQTARTQLLSPPCLSFAGCNVGLTFVQ